jgi:hypothetical protein
MMQTEGFGDHDAEHFVCRLNKGLYGLEQARLLWNKKLNTFLESKLGLNRTQACFNVKQSENGILLVSLHVDDMLFVYSNLNDVQIMFDQLHQKFGIIDLGEPEKILGIRI